MKLIITIIIIGEDEIATIFDKNQYQVAEISKSSILEVGYFSCYPTGAEQYLQEIIYVSERIKFQKKPKKCRYALGLGCHLVVSLSVKIALAGADDPFPLKRRNHNGSSLA